MRVFKFVFFNDISEGFIVAPDYNLAMELATKAFTSEALSEIECIKDMGASVSGCIDDDGEYELY